MNQITHTQDINYLFKISRAHSLVLDKKKLLIKFQLSIIYLDRNLHRHQKYIINIIKKAYNTLHLKK